MIGLGVVGNQPANSYQSKLEDGIHLRWGFLRELGFPWHGFYLYRRPARPGRPLCLSSVSGGLKKGNQPDSKYYSAIGLLSSDVNLKLTEDFTPTNQVEFALDGRQHLRFDLPHGELARRVDLRIGFRPIRCLDFAKLIEMPAPVPGAGRGGIAQANATRVNPLNLEGVIFEVKRSDGNLAGNTQFDSINTNVGPLVGLGCDFGLTIKLPVPCNAVELLMTFGTALVPTGTTFTIEGFDGGSNKVATFQVHALAGPTEPGAQLGRAQPINLSGQSIVRIEVSSIGNAVRLHRICGDKLSFSGDGGAASVKGTVFSGTTPVSTFNVVGTAGQVVSNTIEADAITGIEIGPGEGSLVDLCYVPVAQDATQGWEKLQAASNIFRPEFRYPTGLPVTHADYPCSVPDPRLLLLNRVRYQLPPGWERLPPDFDPPNFKLLRDQLMALVKDGPNGAPMADRIFDAPPEQSSPPDPNPPKLSKLYLLDMLLLGALHPGLAQLLGLYWVDQTAQPNVAYDYLIVADHTGVGQRDADQVLAVIASNGFAQLDGYIVFNQQRVDAPTLPAPDGLQTFELPGGFFPNAQAQLPQACNNAGLRWEVGWDDSDGLLPDSAVMYLVWRAYLGDGATPLPVGLQVLVTKAPPDNAKPLLVTEPRLPKGLAPQRPLDWPPDPIHFIDRNLPDGWYSYEVNGIDLFGRHSPNCFPAQLRLQDKIPPPMPTAVEAYALDPEDRFLQKDLAYDNWVSSLSPASLQQMLVGLRVRWIWTPAHQQQAPDTTEFRIYFQPGANLPTPHDQGIEWQDRYYVVGYNDNVTIDSVSGERAYEIFLPPPTAANPTSIPLNPSLADPVAYAHIGVSAADDKLHTNDQRTTGDWGNRPGNEGRVGPPAKIYRVWRTPPPPPEDALTGDRLYASPADYHSRSFFTYRWQPQPHLKLHVFRAMDDAVFKADWANRPSTAPLDESQVELFPAGWNQATRQQVVDELNQLNTFVPVATRTTEAMAYYRQLSDAALRVLAGLPNSESAFVQLTINALDPNDAANANRLGPDNPDDLVLDLNHRAFIDTTLDGRSTNRYFYRAALVDAALNLGPLGLSSPPVYLPNVVPPRMPVITKVLGGDRQITIKWASNREPDLAGYRIYRTEIEELARDQRLMHLVGMITQTTTDLSATGVEWTDKDNLTGGHKYFYRLTAVDSSDNESAPTRVMTAVAVDTRVPPAPAWIEPTWLLQRETDGAFLAWPADGVVSVGYRPVLRLGWQCETADPEFVIRRWSDEEQVWKQPNNTIQPDSLEELTFTFLDSEVSPTQPSAYRLRVRSPSGVWSTQDAFLAVTPPAFEEP